MFNGQPVLVQIDTELIGIIITGICLVTAAIVTAILGPILVVRYQRKQATATERRLAQKIDDKIATVNTNVDEAKFAVTNEHKTHIREDLDGIKGSLDELVKDREQQSSKITALFSQQANQRARDKKRDRALASMAKAIIGVRTDVASLYDRDTSDLEEMSELDDAIRELERTTPRSTLPKQVLGDIGFAHEETPHDPA